MTVQDKVVNKNVFKTDLAAHDSIASPSPAGVDCQREQEMVNYCISITEHNYLSTGNFKNMPR